MDLSIITVTWRSKEDIIRLIESIKTQVTNLSYEIIVVDNNSGDGSVEILSQKYPELKIIANKDNAGYAKGMNQGMSIAQGDFVACINPDMELRENCFTPLINKIKSDSTIGLIAPQLRYGDGSVQPTIKRDPSLLSQILILLKLHHFIRPKSLNKYLAKDIDYNFEQSAEQLMGAFLMSSRQRWTEIGYWDEDYPLWWEDVQLCLDSRKKGFINLYFPKTYIIHYEGKSFAQVLSLAKQKRFNYGLKLFFKKNHSFYSFLLLSIISPISLFLAWIVQILKIQPRTQSKI